MIVPSSSRMIRSSSSRPRRASGAEIANTLVVSETTVKTHVAHVLTKLRLRDRLQAVVFRLRVRPRRARRGVDMLRVAAVAVLVFGVAGLPSASAQQGFKGHRPR